MSEAYLEKDTEFESALAELEEALETPPLPGELVDWCEQVQQAFDRVHAMYTERTGPAHERQLREICDHNEELAAVAEKLGDEDKAVRAEIPRLFTALYAYVQSVDEKAEGADEQAGEEERETLVQEMLALIIRLRMLEKSLQTWFVEAFQRDRGVAD